MPPKNVKPRFLKTKAQRDDDDAALRSKFGKRKSPTPPLSTNTPAEPVQLPPPPLSTNAAAEPVQRPPPLRPNKATSVASEPVQSPPLSPPNPTISAPGMVNTSMPQRSIIPVVAAAGSAQNDDVDLDLEDGQPRVSLNSLQPSNSAAHSNSPPPSTTDSTANSTAGTSARSIRCKDMVVDTSGQPPKRRRGVVIGHKTRETVRLTNAKIKVEWDDARNMPADKAIGGQLSRDIGMKVRDDVPMLAPVYNDLHTDYKGIVYNYLITFYEIDIEHKGQFTWIQEVAASRYKDWKHDCRRHWEKYGVQVPLEFLKRPTQWEWLCNEFSSEENKELSVKMKRMRRAPTRMNHHSGTTAFGYRAKEHALKGHAAPLVATFKDVYAKDKIGAPIVEAMERDIQKKVDEWNNDHPDSEDVEELPVETQLSVITTLIGEGKGTTYRGLGRGMRREPKKRGGVSRVDVDAMVDARVEERVAERINAVEEKQRQREEALQQQLQQQEEHQRQREQQMKLEMQQQVDAAVAVAIARMMESQQR